MAPLLPAMGAFLAERRRRTAGWGWTVVAPLPSWVGKRAPVRSPGRERATWRGYRVARPVQLSPAARPWPGPAALLDFVRGRQALYRHEPAEEPATTLLSLDAPFQPVGEWPSAQPSPPAGRWASAAPAARDEVAPPPRDDAIRRRLAQALGIDLEARRTEPEEPAVEEAAPAAGRPPERRFPVWPAAIPRAEEPAAPRAAPWPRIVEEAEAPPPRPASPAAPPGPAPTFPAAVRRFFQAVGERLRPSRPAEPAPSARPPQARGGGLPLVRPAERPARRAVQRAPAGREPAAPATPEAAAAAEKRPLLRVPLFRRPARAEESTPLPDQPLPAEAPRARRGRGKPARTARPSPEPPTLPSPSRPAPPPSAPVGAAVPEGPTALPLRTRPPDEGTAAPPAEEPEEAAGSVLSTAGRSAQTLSRRVQENLRRLGPGAPLPQGTRALLEGILRLPLASVRLHTEPEAAAVTGEIGAVAATLGPHVLLSSTRRDLESPGGLALLAHEATHAVQEARRGPTREGAPEAREQEAEAIRSEEVVRQALAGAWPHVAVPPASPPSMPTMPLWRGPVISPESSAVAAGGGSFAAAFPSPAPRAIMATPSVGPLQRTVEVGEMSTSVGAPATSPAQTQAQGQGQAPDMEVLAEEIYRRIRYRLDLEREQRGF